jgi:hypothetical protein
VQPTIFINDFSSAGFQTHLLQLQPIQYGKVNTGEG